MRASRTNTLWAVVLAAAVSLPARADRVDDYIKAEMEKRKIPGLSIAIVKEGKPILLKGYGLSNVEHGVAATEKTVYQLASVSKQFTATAIMILVEEGKLKLDDPIHATLPDLPKEWNGVTIRQLLNHTSGIKSYTSIDGFEKTLRQDFSHEDIIKMAASHPMDFKPGEKHLYNNTGYFLLGMIIEKATGKTYNDYLTEKIFKPLGMSSTRLNSLQEIIPNRAQGYALNGARLNHGEYTSPTQPYSAGALISNVQDMARWDAALYSNTIVKRETLEQMWSPTKLTDGKSVNYGFGWALAQAPGHKVVLHGGGISGFSTNISRVVDEKLSVVVLTNLESGSADSIARGVLSQFVPSLAPPKPAERAAKEDPAVTAHLKKIISDTAAGKLEPGQFNEEMQKAIFPDRVKDAGEFLKSAGALKSLKLIGENKMGDLRIYRYRVEFEKMKLICTFGYDAKGKVTALALGPED